MSFDVAKFMNKLDGDEKYWISVIEQDDLECGVLKLNPGTKDVQSPHKKDEIYHILEGNGFLNIDGSDFEISYGKILLVNRGVNHHFHSNTKTIKAVYFLN